MNAEHAKNAVRTGFDPPRMYEYLCKARERILDWARPLGAEGYTRTFDIGLGSLARTLTHIMICEWYYIERLEGREVPPYAQWPIRDEDPPPLGGLETLWSRQAERTRVAIAGVREWGALLEYKVEDERQRSIIVSASKADMFTQLFQHEVHHRAQAMNMLRRLGITLEDLDFNAMMYAKRPAV